jgi:hypothetical protein
MPVVFTFDIKGAPSNEYNRIQSFFERFGWENLGGSSYRYPPPWDDRSGRGLAESYSSGAYAVSCLHFVVWAAVVSIHD